MIPRRQRPAPQHMARRRRWVRLRAVLGLGAVLGVGAVGTFAHWTDSVEVSGTTFTAGTIDLLIAGDPDDAVAFTTMSFSALVPGSATAGVLTVKNAGTAPLKYTAVAAASNADAKGLRDHLTARVTGAATVTGSAPSATCGGSVLAGTGTGFNAGIVTTGRTLAAGSTETLCVQATLSAAAPSALQGATTDITFTFTATSDLS